MGGSSGGSYLNFLAPEEYQSASRSWGEVPRADDLVGIWPRNSGNEQRQQRPFEDDDVEEGLSGHGRASQIKHRFSQPTW